MRNTLMVCAVIALASSPTVAQQKQLSITTASPDALVLYQKALDYVENVESESARPLARPGHPEGPWFRDGLCLARRHWRGIQRGAGEP